MADGDQDQPVARTTTGSNESLLQCYYDRLFPFNELYTWIAEKTNSEFSHREFSMTLQNDAYLRFRSYKTMEDWRHDVRDLCPVKLDLGAVYNAPPSQRAAVKDLACVEKEFCIDIDLSDYNDIRTCCKDAQICPKCWLFAVAAIKVIDGILLNDFGFSQRVWIFSGRRGVHCWVSDNVARALSTDQRGHLITFLSVYDSNSQRLKANLFSPLHPTLKEAYKVLEPYFARIMVEGEDILGDQARWGSVLSLIPDQELQNQLERHFQDKDEKGGTRWRLIKHEVENRLNPKTINPKNKHLKWDTVLPHIVFTFTYPRLDVNVSKQVNHLLKLPFCAHPSTGLICIPLDVSSIDTFIPSEHVPNLTKLYAEAQEGVAAESGSLARHVRSFQRLTGKDVKPSDMQF